MPSTTKETKETSAGPSKKKVVQVQGQERNSGEAEVPNVLPKEWVIPPLPDTKMQSEEHSYNKMKKVKWPTLLKKDSPDE